MGLSHLFFFKLFILVSLANIELSKKYIKDGSKSSFIQEPYISIVRDQKVKEIQEEITNIWPDGIITYYLDDKSYDLSIGTHIRTAMRVLEEETCIRFRVQKEKPEGNGTWIHITNPSKRRHCVHDRKFMDKGEIMLILGYDCLKQEELLHSLLHGIGFKDEVTHPHRDKYIRVMWDNIQPAHRYLYKIQPVEIFTSIVEYDPLSIMHFHDRAFSSNGKATILPLEPGLIISPSESLSQLDKMRLQLYFGHECNKRKFSSLLETCKKSLKGGHDILSAKAEEDLSKDKIDSGHKDSKENEKTIENENTIENEEKVLKTEGNLEAANVKESEKENSIENIKSKNVESNEEGKVSKTEGMKENKTVEENSEDKILSEDINKKQGGKENHEENSEDKNLSEDINKKQGGKENHEGNSEDKNLSEDINKKQGGKENHEENSEDKNLSEDINKKQGGKENHEENSEDKNLSEDINKKQGGKENHEENSEDKNFSEDINKKQGARENHEKISKAENDSEKVKLDLVTTKGLLLIPNFQMSNEAIETDLSAIVQKKEEQGINLNYETGQQ